MLKQLNAINVRMELLTNKMNHIWRDIHDAS